MHAVLSLPASAVSNYGLQQTAPGGTRLALSAPPLISSQGDARKARATRPAAEPER